MHESAVDSDGSSGSCAVAPRAGHSAGAPCDSDADHSDTGSPAHATAVSAEKQFDALLVVIGDFGRYQIWLFVLVCVFAALTNIPCFVQLVFQTYIPKYRCQVPGCDVDNSSSTSHHSPFNASFLPFSVPFDSKSGSYDKCRRFWRRNIASDICDASQFDCNVTVTCTHFVFDRSVFVSSFVTQWNLTCQYESLVELPSTLYFFGVLVGSLVFGFVSDRCGRRWALMTAALMVTVANGLTVLAASSFASVCAARVFIGMASTGLFQTGFVLVLETVGGRWRVVCGSALNIFTTLGVLAAVALGYWQRNWRSLQTISSAPLLFLISAFWLFPESPRWLLAQQRHRDAARAIEKMARCNGHSSPWQQLLSGCQPAPPGQLPRAAAAVGSVRMADGDSAGVAPGHGQPTGSMTDCVREGSMRLRLLLSLFSWFSVNLSFYGLVTDMQHLPGDYFTNLLVMTLAELPGYVLGGVLMDRVGRRVTFVSSTLVCGAAAIVAGVTPHGLPVGCVLNTALLVTAKCGSCVSFVVVYVMTSELFPTAARNTALGLCSTCGRVAAILAPQIANLASYGDSVPLLVIGVSSVLSGLCSVFLPETSGTALPETLQQALDIGNSRGTRSEHAPLLSSEDDEVVT